ncbi:MAG: rod shape-determining protein RodA [Spirochaetales bacterium]
MNVIGRARRFDIPLLFAVYALLTIGILFIYSGNITSQASFSQQEHVRQITWALLGTALLFGVAATDLDRIRRYSAWIYVGIVLLLVATLLFGRVMNGARRWIGLFGFGMQPSEFAKIGVIIFLARLMEASGSEIRQLYQFLLFIAAVMLPLILVLLQPDLGTAIAFTPALFTMALVAGATPRHLIFFAATGVLTLVIAALPSVGEHVLTDISNVLGVFASPRFVLLMAAALVAVVIIGLIATVITRKHLFSWVSFAAGVGASSVIGGFLIQRVLRPYQIMRMIVFLDPQIDPQGSGWHTIQSLTAVGSGGFSGKGLFEGTQSQYQYLPLQSTDFIFSILAEEWGFLGALLVFALYGFLLFRGLVIAARARDMFSALLATGVTTLFAFHFFVNVGMTVGIMPITGIPLMLFSYGGSSVWAAMICVGLLVNVSARSGPAGL